MLLASFFFHRKWRAQQQELAQQAHAFVKGTAWWLGLDYALTYLPEVVAWLEAAAEPELPAIWAERQKMARLVGGRGNWD